MWQIKQFEIITLLPSCAEMTTRPKAKISIYRCHHVSKRNIGILTHCDVTWHAPTDGVAERKQFSIKYECDLAWARHLNYFRWMNFNGRQNLKVEIRCLWAVEVMQPYSSVPADLWGQTLTQTHTRTHYLQCTFIHSFILGKTAYSLQYRLCCFFFSLCDVSQEIAVCCLPIQKRWTGLLRTDTQCERSAWSTDIAIK